MPIALIFATISIIAVIFTVYDKYASKNRTDRRIPEKTLLLVAIVGGSVVMYITMKLIRHKTKHAKFMVGLPVIIFLQLVVTVTAVLIL